MESTITAANRWECDANEDKIPRNWKKKEETKLGTLNVEVLQGCTKICTIDYENIKVLLKIDLWDLVLQNFEEISIPRNPPDDNKNGMGNINMEENKKGEKGSSGTECCLSKI